MIQSSKPNDYISFLDSIISSNNSAVPKGSPSIVLKKTYPVDRYDRYYLLFSSLFFFFPAVQAFSNQVYFLGTMSVLTGLASLQFWWFGLPDWRLTLDKTVAYSTTVCYLSTGFLHVVYDDIQGNVLYPILYVFFCLSAARAYSLSCHQWNQGQDTWVIYHMAFHLFLSCGKYVVIEVSRRTP